MNTSSMHAPSSYRRFSAPRRSAMRPGFTLIEILVMLGIITILAAILLPVLASARGRARQISCASSLKQLGLAFTLYSQDFDSLLPNPGGRGMQANATNKAVAVLENASVWCLYGGEGGLASYLQGQKGATDDTWTCPSAASQGIIFGIGAPELSQYNIGRTYVMNDYLRAAHPGQAVTAAGDVPGTYNPTFHSGIMLDAVGSNGNEANGGATSASQVILVYEGVENQRGTAQRNGSPYFGFSPSRYGSGDLPANVPEEYHFERSNFLFCDGHVKALRPTQTWTRATQAALEQFNPAYAHARGGRSGSGDVDMWNPQTSAVTYP